MNPTIKSIGSIILERCCKPHLLQECMRTFGCLYGDYKFVPSAQNVTIQQATMSYHFDDARPSDIVLDIGAHVGGFSIIVSGMVDKVYAVEPIYTKELMENIELNGIKNVNMVCCGLGEGTSQLEFNGKASVAQCYDLGHIINTFCSGHVDFLKIDCEGGEWSINPSDLDGIRRIEGEIHKTADHENMFDFIDMLKETGYITEVEKNNGHTMIFHATIKE